MQRAVITEFITLYRDRPCLWNNRLEQYNNKSIRQKVLNELLKILQKIEPHANIDTVRKKIDNLRTMYNRERRKVLASENSGCPPEMVYKPSLWYYNQMSFLNELETPTKFELIKKEIERNMAEETGDSLAGGSEMEQEAPQQSMSAFPPIVSCGSLEPGLRYHDNSQVQETYEEPEIEPPPSKRPRQSIIKVRALKIPEKTTDRDSDDELDFFSKMAAKTLRKLEEPTQSIALKLMSDVLYHAKMGHLSENSGISTPITSDATEVPCSTEQVAYIGSQTPEYRPKSPNYRAKSPNYRTKSPNYAAMSSSYASKSPNYTPKSPIYTPKSPNYTPKSPIYTAKSPNYTPKSPIHTPKSPIYTAKSPNYTYKSPNYSSKSPNYTPSSPVYIPQSPNYRPSSPNYDVGPSSN